MSRETAAVLKPVAMGDCWMSQCNNQHGRMFMRMDDQYLSQYGRLQCAFDCQQKVFIVKVNASRRRRSTFSTCLLAK